MIVAIHYFLFFSHYASIIIDLVVVRFKESVLCVIVSCGGRVLVAPVHTLYHSIMVGMDEDDQGLPATASSGFLLRNQHSVRLHNIQNIIL